jgi:hypothetical protein
MRTLVAIMVGAGLIGSAGAARAHHSFAAEYDANTRVNLKGTVTQVRLINPHSWIYIDVKQPDGTNVTWGIEGGTPNALFRKGFTKDSVPVGTEILVDGFRARNKSNSAVGVNVTFADGRKLFLGGSAPGADGGPPQ